MGAFGKLQAIMFVTLLSKPFKDWKAYKLGLIDLKGKKIKEPQTSEEKKALGMFENLVRKIKSIIMKFLPSSNYLQFVLAAYLLKENVSDEENEAKKAIDEVLTEEENELLMKIISNKIIHSK